MDAIYSTGLGLKNLNRVMNNLLAATTHEGDDWEDLSVVYGRVLQQWERELGHVAQIVGGVDSQEKHGGQEGVRFTPVAKDRQVAAVKFLNENAFATPTMFLKPEVLRRMEPNGALDRIKASQMRVLTGLLTTARIGRLVEEEAIDGAAAYRPVDFLSDVRRGVFQEIYSANPKIDAYRRNLQRGYLDLIAGRLNGAAQASDDERPLLRGELHVLTGDVSAALAKTTDRNTKLHMEDLRDQVTKILDPKFQPSTRALLVAPVITVDGESQAGRCWPED